jgi:hypothetical protein
VSSVKKALRARVQPENASRALSHVLDASMQRIGRRGRVEVAICQRALGCSSKERRCDVIEVRVSDTGVNAVEELQPWIEAAEGPVGGRCLGERAAAQLKAEQSAAEAMDRVKAGLPVGSGSMSLRIAEGFIAGFGGSLSVVIQEEEQAAPAWVHTTVRLPAA